jgi:hypothetical protein
MSNQLTELWSTSGGVAGNTETTGAQGEQRTSNFRATVTAPSVNQSPAPATSVMTWSQQFQTASPDHPAEYQSETQMLVTTIQNETDPQDTTTDILESLSSRGKGIYFCPYGVACTKGGVQSNGERTLFERNSAFR